MTSCLVLISHCRIQHPFVLEVSNAELLEDRIGLLGGHHLTMLP